MITDLLFVLHDQFTTVGTTAEWAKTRGLKTKLVYTDTFTKKAPDFSAARGLILFGGDMQVWDTETYPWLAVEKEHLGRALDRNQHVIGLCLGAQLIAEHYGGDVRKMEQPEVGWGEIDVVGRSTPVVPLHWHFSEFSLGRGCERTASNAVCANQAFRHGPHQIGYQFHAEVDQERLAHALEKWKPSLKGPVQDKEEIRRQGELRIPALKNWYFDQLDSWFQS